MFKKILIANRGEIACRVIRTCKRLGIATVAVHSDVDAFAMHVQMADEAHSLGGARPADSYLKGELILAIAQRTGAQAIHPGYGFLSENEDFARAVEAAGLVFIGPTAKQIEQMGSKSAAKRIMEQAGVPVVPGYHGDNQDPAFLQKEADRVGYPLLIKAVAGGGGKGMRLVEKSSEFMTQLESAKREAKNSFNDDVVLLERYVLGPHHIEFQVFGDTHGNAVHLFERECSIQRRHQKILEESPSPFLEMKDDGLRERMGDAAVAAAKAISYRGAGTIEFIVGENREFFFMEMNTRLQVEHPVTEMITGEDLVEWQLRVASGEPLPLLQSEIMTGGHAIELRVCAENPDNDFLPEVGHIEAMTIHHEVAPDPAESADVRLDTGVRSGDTISVFYDPMIAKLIAWGIDRPQTIRKLQAALAQSSIIGVKTNLDFLAALVEHPAFNAGHTDTSFIARYRNTLGSSNEATPFALAGAVAKLLLDEQAAKQTSQSPTPWLSNSGWRINAPAKRLIEFKQPEQSDDEHDVVHELWLETIAATAVSPTSYVLHSSVGALPFRFGSANGALQVSLGDESASVFVLRADGQFAVNARGQRVLFELYDPYHYVAQAAGNEGRLTAMMPGRVVKLLAKAGDMVKKGQPLIIMEAMKMEHTIVSPKDGVIDRAAFAEGELVPADAVLFAFAEA
jgi:3-methylcrotonyl-CoA carboxylase alpha subunit